VRINLKKKYIIIIIIIILIYIELDNLLYIIVIYNSVLIRRVKNLQECLC